MESTTFKVKGMTCMGCVGSVKRVLQGIAGVTTVDVSLENGEAKVQYDPGVTQPAALKTAVNDAGYEAN